MTSGHNMAGKQVRAVYDFSGEPGTAELSIISGELLTLTRQDVGEGWWEGINQSNQTGLFPAAYVEEVKYSNTEEHPSMPPPPLPDGFSDSNWEQASPQTDAGDYWEDDDWDDDQEGPGPTQSVVQGHNIRPQPDRQVSKLGSIDADDISIGRSGDGKGTVGKKNFNRFSGFGKSGLESFLMNSGKLDVADSDRVTVIETEVGYEWNPITDFYSCIVASPKKESKLKGLKSFIAYQITPTFNNIQVSRRYKHFDWLHERLEEKFSLIPIPPLPDKQISGRYEGQFIEHRRIQLQAFVTYVCRHPVLSRCSVWHHFMTCTDEKRWKIGKRKEEKDKLLGASYLFALETPDRPLDLLATEQESENCARFMHNMDGAVKNLMATAADQAKKCQGPYKREYQKVGQSFLQLAAAFKDSASGSSQVNLTTAIKYTGDTYNNIGVLFEEQPKLDWEPLGDMLHIYKGILASFPDILAAHKGSMHKRKECEKQALENKLDEPQLEIVKRRSDVVSCAVLAEMNHFHAERTVEFKIALKSYLAEQIQLYQKVVDNLQNALEQYE